MGVYPKTVEQVMQALGKLPTIGPKSAERLTLHLLKAPKAETLHLAAALITLRESTRTCARCSNFSDEEECGICRDPQRDQGLLCVVEEPRDILAIEKTGSYRGTYHALLGVLSPLQGVGPDDLKIAALVDHVKRRHFREVILAMNSTAEGEATALYLTRLLKPLEVPLSRLASGIPVGNQLEHTDQATLTTALEARRPL